MQETSISWADYSLGTVHGCSKVSAGCDHCYAERVSHRFNHTELPWTLENADENISTKEEKLDEPKRVSEGSFIFVNSMSDLFHSKVPEEFIRRHARLARQTPRHIYQILTKRPARAAHMDIDWPENVWIGTSVEDERVVPRIDMLRDVSASTKFVSFEPLIGSVGDVDLTGIDWAIVGGESGPEHREMDHAWAREILDAARRDDVAFYFKQSAARQPERGQALTVVREDGVKIQQEIREIPDLPEVTIEARSQQTEQDTLVTDGGVDDEPPELDEVMDFPDEPRTDERRWIVLFEEDYDNVAIDPNGNVGVLVDIEQTGELFRLAGQTLSSLSHRDAEPDEPIRDLIEALEEVLDDE